jgi:hypothetical protein
VTLSDVKGLSSRGGVGVMVSFNSLICENSHFSDIEMANSAFFQVED